MSLDYQDSLLRDINKDLLLTNANLKTSTEEVIRQGGQLTNIQGNLDDANKHIKKTDNTMVDINNEKVAELQKNSNIELKTSQASIGEAMDLVEKINDDYDEIFVLPIASSVSGSENT